MELKTKIVEGFLFLIIPTEKAKEVWELGIFELVVLHDDDTEMMIQRSEEIEEAKENEEEIAISVGYISEPILYRVIKTDDAIEVITQDGGIASYQSEDGNFLTTYYQNKLTDVPDGQDVWQYLSEGKAYMKDWDESEDGPTEEQVVQDALSWLVCGEKYFQRDDSIFTKQFPHHTKVRPDFDIFLEKYQPQHNVFGLKKYPNTEPDSVAPYTGRMYETYGEELEEVQKHENKYIWTLVDSGGSDCTIIAGLHLVNRMGYFICAVPWDNQNEEFEG